MLSSVDEFQQLRDEETFAKAVSECRYHSGKVRLFIEEAAACIVKEMWGEAGKMICGAVMWICQHHQHLHPLDQQNWSQQLVALSHLIPTGER